MPHNAIRTYMTINFDLAKCEFNSTTNLDKDPFSWPSTVVASTPPHLSVAFCTPGVKCWLVSYWVIESGPDFYTYKSVRCK